MVDIIEQINGQMKEQGRDTEATIRIIGHCLAKLGPKHGYLQFNFKDGNFVNHNRYETKF